MAAAKEATEPTGRFEVGYLDKEGNEAIIIVKADSVGAAVAAAAEQKKTATSAVRLPDDEG